MTNKGDNPKCAHSSSSSSRTKSERKTSNERELSAAVGMNGINVTRWTRKLDCQRRKQSTEFSEEWVGICHQIVKKAMTKETCQIQELLNGHSGVAWNVIRELPGMSFRSCLGNSWMTQWIKCQLESQRFLFLVCRHFGFFLSRLDFISSLTRSQSFTTCCRRVQSIEQIFLVCDRFLKKRIQNLSPDMSKERKSGSNASR